MLGNNGSSGSVHDKTQTLAFLQLLDPSAQRFTWQFFYDDKSLRGHPLPSGLSPVIHDTLEKVWPLVEKFNTPACGIGVFITINETDFLGRKQENIQAVRALF